MRRDAERLEAAVQNVDQKVAFGHQGMKYTVIRTSDFRFTVIRNGRLVKDPPKFLLKKARQMMAVKDVEDVHEL